MMMEFEKSEWDEPDVWSTPTHSPSQAFNQNNNSTGSNNELKAENKNNDDEFSSTTPTQATQPSSSFSHQPDSFMNFNDQISNTLTSSSSTPTAAINSTISSSSSHDHWGSSSNFDQPPTGSSSSSLDQFSGFHPFGISSNQSSTEEGSAESEDEFGEFDDGELKFDENEKVGDDNDGFGDSIQSSFFNQSAQSQNLFRPQTRVEDRLPVTPFRLPEIISRETLSDSLQLGLYTLFQSDLNDDDGNDQIGGSNKGVWLSESISKKIFSNPNPTGLLNSSSAPPSPSIPPTSSNNSNIKRRDFSTGGNNSHNLSSFSILKSDRLRSTWKTLSSDPIQHGLGRPVDYKRSQIRRFYLVNLGIPIDLNDFLAPPPLKSLSVDIQSSNKNSNNIGGAGRMESSPIHDPNLRNGRSNNLIDQTPMFDQIKCNRILKLTQDELLKEELKKLEIIRDDLINLNQQASDFLSFKVSQKEQADEDNKSYNTMISDLILAAQRIKMANNGSSKRSSSITMGSSSIASNYK